MTDERRIFPVETVLALVNGRDDAEVEDLASYISGQSPVCAECAKAVGPFAAAWVLRWQPKLNDVEWKQDEKWQDYVRRAKNLLGDRVSLVPIDGRLKALCDQVVGELKSLSANLARQKDAALELESKAREVEPLRAQSQEARKKCDQLEEQLKKMKADLGAAQRDLLQYKGKLAIDNDELMSTIKDAIKSGLKGLAIGAGTAAGATAAADEPAEHSGDTAAPPEDFGFGSSGNDGDGFGF